VTFDDTPFDKLKRDIDEKMAALEARIEEQRRESAEAATKAERAMHAVNGFSDELQELRATLEGINTRFNPHHR
jgi:chromosome segregation ATPase